MKYKHDIRIFFQYVIPSVLSFALSGVYAIVDGFFVGNSMGDIGVSAINIDIPLWQSFNLWERELEWEEQFIIQSAEPKKRRHEQKRLLRELCGC